ncbi:MAG: baseplate J/gp47 family protein [Desulfobulbus oligotrophicus]|jgi:hypothetical protein|nr:baseplate J/gp47 family protein [Desulfobulbus oligotrophicus]
MTLDCTHTHPLQHDGTSQNERFLAALDPENVRIHQFDLRDWMRFAYHFGARLNYFSTADAHVPDGNWQEFMKAEDEIREWLKDASLVAGEKWLEEEERERILQRPLRGNYEPHLALFLAFLKLMRFSQEHLNRLSKRHLDFYYTQVLQLSKKPAVPDRVHVLFELARNAAATTVPAGSVLDGGKDVSGRPLHYVTESEITVNSAKVALIKSIYHQAGDSVRYAEMTDSVDGLGTEFKDGQPVWNGFGNDSWPTATLGFALASTVLLLKEGERTITLSLDLDFPDALALPAKENYDSELQVFFSGEKDWIAATKINLTHLPDTTTKTCELTATVDAGQPAIVPYEEKIHGERFTTNLPVVRVLVNTGTSGGYAIYSLFSHAVIKSAQIDVRVIGARDVVLENDHGRLDPSKPFHPFGPLPKKGAGFYIGSHEIFQKDWQQVQLHMQWKDKPDNLATHYAGYLDNGLAGEPIIAGDADFTVLPQYLNNNSWYPPPSQGTAAALFESPITIEHDPADAPPAALRVPPLLMRKGVNINKAVLRNYLVADETKTDQKKRLISNRFEATRFNPGFASLVTRTSGFDATTASGFIRLVLQADFLHDLYPKLLTLWMTQRADGNPDLQMPNAPYTPLAASFSLDYTATATNTFIFTSQATPKEKYDNFTKRAIQLFHEHPFGQAEQHIFLKEQCDFFEDPTASRQMTVMPRYAPEGELYIGIADAQPSSSLSLLFAAAEGSEDPLAPTFGKDQHIAWYSLANNEWQLLNHDFLTGDTTNDLLRSGIVTMNLPAAINASNTLLDADLYWLKAQLPKGLHHTSVCRLIGIHSQAVSAVLQDSANDPAHLNSSLPAATINRLIDKPAGIKGVDQPYGSFGGVRQENDHTFYLRVSERMRHKQRAVTIWDYERLILQAFPAIHKVKCISHTFVPTQSGDPAYDELAPGSVSLVVIPDIRNKHLFDRLQPRASENTLREIEHFLAPLIGLHVRCRVAHPAYETVALDFRVKFHSQYDAHAYQAILNEDILRFLSPWAFGESSTIHFGGRLYKSVLIRFIEELAYVDFISRFKMYHRIGAQDGNVKDKNEIVASSARAVLAAAPIHTITVIESDKVCNE